ncbi:MAG TPA: NAD(P)-binding domain-containing protein [Kofleriaceae bacterium]|nr:NAD(P)-binding domain-containing protein [Kofleriaceae bacterium]
MTAALGVVGAGAFGTALAAVVGRTGQPVLVWSTGPALVDAINREHRSERLPGVELPEAVRATGDPAELAASARMIAFAVPSTEVRARAAALGASLDGRHLLVHAVGSSAGPQDAPVSAVLLEETPARRIGTLAGPALPADLVAGRFAAMVCASPFDEVTREARRLFNLPPALRLYTSRDLAGVELAAALSGAYSVAIGMADALDMGPGPRAVLITRVVAEAQRLVVASGGEPRTFAGLAGLGNLLVRTSSGSGEQAPGYAHGRALGAGRRPEGDRIPDPVRAIGAGVRLARRLGERAPVLEAIAQVVDGGATARQAAAALSDTVAMAE